MTVAPLILTAKLDAASLEYFDRLRKEHFPPERNFLAAHVTLFHHLPGENIDEIVETLETVAEMQPPFALTFDSWRFLGRGVAMKIASVELATLRNKLAGHWQHHLTPQDRQKFQPHITIQNKTEPQAARELFENVSQGHQPFDGVVVGTTLWSYLGGPWRLEKEFLFEEY